MFERQPYDLVTLERPLLDVMQMFKHIAARLEGIQIGIRCEEQKIHQNHGICRASTIRLMSLGIRPNPW